MKKSILLASIFFMFSCAATKQNNWLQEHQNLLQQTQVQDISTDKKLDIFMESYVEMMHQSLDFLNPKKGVAFAEKYNNQNKDILIQIIEEVNDDFSKLSKVEKIGKGINMMSKPYAKEFVDLFPRFHKKYKFLNSITDVNKRIKEAIFEKLGL